MSVALECSVCAKPFVVPPSKAVHRRVCSQACRIELGRRPCSTEGCGRPHQARGLCKKCYAQRYYNDPVRQAAAKQRERERWNGADDETKVARLERKRQYEKRRRQDPKERERRRQYRMERSDHNNGFSPALVASLRATQKGQCAICTVEMTRGNGPRGMHRDHCHATGRPRGLLCRTCNTCLGHYEKHQRPAGLRIDAYECYLS